jgi:large subunit ribosomal protein L10
MAKELKRLITREWKKEFSGVHDLVLVDASKLKGPQTWAFRGKLAASKLRMRVLQNRVARIAFRESGLQAAEGLLRGPTAVVYGGDGAADISRALAAWNRQNPPVAIKGGLIEGNPGTPKDVESWAKLPSRPELLSQVLGVLIAPATEIASAFEAALSQFANLAAAHVEKMEKIEKETPAPTPPAPEAAPPAGGAAPEAKEAPAGGAAPEAKEAPAGGAAPGAKEAPAGEAKPG